MSEPISIVSAVAALKQEQLKLYALIDEYFEAPLIFKTPEIIEPSAFQVPEASKLCRLLRRFTLKRGTYGY
jgi:hypothetical protein